MEPIGRIGHAASPSSESAADYDFPIEVGRAAIAYYERHRSAIDARLGENYMSVS